MKSVADELDFLRKTFRQSLKAYGNRIEGEIVTIREAVLALAESKRVPQARIKDLRDMLSLLRRLQTRPEKGRRKDLRKIDALIGELHLFTDNW